LPRKIIPALQQENFFYVWTEQTDEVRLMCSFDTTEEEVKSFGKKIKGLLASA